VTELRDDAPPGPVEGGGFGGRHREIVVLSFSVVYSAVAMVTRFRVLEDLFGDRERDHENLDSSDNQAHNLLKY